MKNSWLSMRRDLFLRDLFQDFFEAKKNFEKIHQKYQRDSSVSYKTMNAWVGTETAKGPLWNLKDLSHCLFRNTGEKNGLYEHLFDWTIGSIFHETIKLKEGSYQIESYKPLLDSEITSHKRDPGLSGIISEYFVIIEKVNRNLSEDIRSIDELFSQALFHLKEILITNSSNVLLLRYWVDNRKTVEKYFGKNSLKESLEKMFPEGQYEAYLMISENCIARGWINDAEKYAKKALRINPGNKKVKNLLSELDAKKQLDIS